jgi:hypothetical protein
MNTSPEDVMIWLSSRDATLQERTLAEFEAEIAKCTSRDEINAVNARYAARLNVPTVQNGNWNENGIWGGR